LIQLEKLQWQGGLWPNEVAIEKVVCNVFHLGEGEFVKVRFGEH
jgi:hypothetical protein